MAIHHSVYTFNKHKEKMERDIRAIQDFKDIELKYNEGVDKDGQRYRECIADSGIYKGEKLYYEYENEWGSIEGHCYELLEQKVNAELEKLFESDVKEFSESFAKKFGHILAKHGIDNPQKWFEEKMRMENANTYTYAPYASYWGGAFYDKERKVIKFSTFYNLTKFTRAHETGHKVTDETKIWNYKTSKYHIGRLGFVVWGVEPRTSRIFGKRAIYHLIVKRAWGLNEGMTNLFAEKLTGLNFENYKTETNIAKKIAQVVGEDTVFEAMLFNPKILEDKWKELSGDKYSLANITHSIEKDFLSCSDGANYARKEIKRVARRINKKGKKAINSFRNFVYFAFSNKEEIYEALKLRIHCFLYSETVPMPPPANERNSITNISANDETRQSSRQTLKNVHIKSEPEIDKEKNI